MAACGGGARGGDGSGAVAPTAEPRSTADLEAIYRARADSARTRFSDADVRFMRGMIVHHAQALVMAALAEDRDASPRIRTLAARIANGQRDEIQTMRRWLEDRGRRLPGVRVEGTTMTVEGAGDHPAHMPGMLTERQLRELGEARGPAFDRLFLTYMIQHHRGAVDMVLELFGTDGAAQDEAVFRLASDIQVDQRTEIARMERMLESLSREPEDP